MIMLKDISGYEGEYLISNKGEVFSFKANKYMKIKTQNGYGVIKLTKKGMCKFYLVHRLVAEAFIENPENKPFVNHKDANRINNDVSNLEWCTPQENLDHARVNGLLAHTKIEDSDVLAILSAYFDSGESLSSIAKRYNIKPHTVYYYTTGTLRRQVLSSFIRNKELIS